ncbi:helix-turn-helix domain-containing protein [Lentzea sp. NPDC092896]|uniref:AlbA family DNA-binding domain-containing protein n=1 Tax=Lentzea sp. NPDC092896 TaxID=3364127 RepID=UPI0037F5C211
MPPVLYLGPAQPRWQPRTLADVQVVLAAGLLVERHWLDAKREIGSSPQKKVELVRDLASFANDGGALLIGIAEDKAAGTFSLAPQPLDGLSETVEQLVRYHCDPPLFVQCHRIAAPGGPGGAIQGVLVVEVPPSPLAPHMVKGQYHGRGDTVKHVLSDAEVERLHMVRRARQVLAQELIDREIARDPFPSDLLDARLYVVARPLASPPELLTENVSAFGVAPLISEAEAPGASRRWPRAVSAEPRAKGFGWCTPNLTGRQWTGESRTGTDLEVWDDGTLTLLANAMSTKMNLLDEELYVARTETVLGLVRSVVQLAGAIGAEFGYTGQWQFAVGVTGLAGLRSEVPERRRAFTDPEELSTFSEERYVAATMASTIELGAEPAAVTHRLMMRFARALDVLKWFENADYLGAPGERATRPVGQ